MSRTTAQIAWRPAYTRAVEAARHLDRRGRRGGAASVRRPSRRAIGEQPLDARRPKVRSPGSIDSSTVSLGDRVRRPAPRSWRNAGLHSRIARRPRIEHERCPPAVCCDDRAIALLAASRIPPCAPRLPQLARARACTRQTSTMSSNTTQPACSRKRHWLGGQHAVDRLRPEHAAHQMVGGDDDASAGTSTRQSR